MDLAIRNLKSGEGSFSTPRLWRYWPNRSYTIVGIQLSFDQFTGEVGLATHDLGGPAGLYWARNSSRRLTKLVILNTLVDDDLSLMEQAFLSACKMSGLGSFACTRWSVRQTIRFGVRRPSKLERETLQAYRAPFVTADDREALRKSLADLNLSILKGNGEWLAQAKTPCRSSRESETGFCLNLGKLPGV